MLPVVYLFLSGIFFSWHFVLGVRTVLMKTKQKANMHYINCSFIQSFVLIDIVDKLSQLLKVWYKFCHFCRHIVSAMLQPSLFYFCKRKNFLLVAYFRVDQACQSVSGYIEFYTNVNAFQHVSAFAMRLHFCISLLLGLSLSRPLITGGKAVLEVDQ